jgi:hypothetical protein
MKRLLITVIGLVLFYFVVLIPVMEHELRVRFDSARACVIASIHYPDNPCQQECFNAQGQVRMPWWFWVYEHITYRPLLH